MTVKYLIEENQITFYYKGEIKYVTSSNPYLLDSLRDALIKGKTDFESTCFSFKEAFLNAMESDGNNYFGINKKLNSLKSADLPLEPLKVFVSNLRESVLEKTPDIIEKVGTVEAPLTWDGKLILYTRAAWLPTPDSQNSSLKDWMGNQFSPNKVVHSKPNNSLQAGLFNWIAGVCPDTGNTYEVVVEANDIVSFSSNTFFYLDKFTHLSCLGKKPTIANKASTGVVELETQCSKLGEELVVRLPYSVSTAARLMASAYRNKLDLDSIEQQDTVKVLAGSC